MNARRMMTSITTTNQKKNTTIPGIAYPATVLALATDSSYPAPPGLSAILYTFMGIARTDRRPLGTGGGPQGQQPPGVHASERMLRGQRVTGPRRHHGSTSKIIIF